MFHHRESDINNTIISNGFHLKFDEIKYFFSLSPRIFNIAKRQTNFPFYSCESCTFSRTDMLSAMKLLELNCEDIHKAVAALDGYKLITGDKTFVDGVSLKTTAVLLEWVGLFQTGAAFLNFNKYFTTLVDPESDHSIPKNSLKIFQTMNEQLRNLVTSLYKSLNTTTSPTKTNDPREKVLNDRRFKNGYAFFNEHGERKDCFKIRVQKSGLCYFLAPCLLVHYLRCLNTKENEPVIDVPRYITRYFSGSAFEDFLKDLGDNSLDFLKGLLMSGSKVEEFDLRDLGKLNIDWFEKFGPMLISQLETFVGMENNNVYVDRVDLEKKESHAMQLAGFAENDFGRMYLVQNS